MRHSAIGQIFPVPLTHPEAFANVNLVQCFSHFLAANAITEILYYIKPPSQITPPSVYHVHNGCRAHKGVAPPPPQHTDTPLAVP